MKSKERMSKKSSSGGASAKTAGIGMSAGMSAPFKPSPEQVKQDQQYRAEDDLRTLHRAHQIVTDKPRHGAVKALAAQQTKAIMKFGKKR
jgi:hypothetical protein